MSPPKIDPEIFMEAKTMLNDKFDELLFCYQEDTKSYLQEMDAAFKNQKLSIIIEHSHLIKSSSRQIGFLIMGDVAEILEKKARDYVGNEKAYPYKAEYENLKEMKEIFKTYLPELLALK